MELEEYNTKLIKENAANKDLLIKNDEFINEIKDYKNEQYENTLNIKLIKDRNIEIVELKDQVIFN